ncbi:hypothetical protein GN956_G19003 [Arapaima gigas]
MFFSTKSSVRRKTCSASRQKECGSITERRCQEGPGRPFPVGNTAGRRRTRGRQRGARRRTAVPCNLPDKCYLLSGPSEKLSKGRGPPSRGVTSLPDNSEQKRATRQGCSVGVQSDPRAGVATALLVSAVPSSCTSILATTQKNLLRRTHFRPSAFLPIPERIPHRALHRQLDGSGILQTRPFVAFSPGRSRRRGVLFVYGLTTSDRVHCRPSCPLLQPTSRRSSECALVSWLLSNSPTSTLDPCVHGGARQPRVAGGSPQEDPEPPPKRSNCSAASKVEQEHPRLETASSAPSPEGSTFGECNT